MAKKIENESISKRILVKKERLDIIDKLSDVLSDERKYTLQDYRVIGKEEEQATNWRTGELLWEDDEQTIPMYKDKYGYVDKASDELSESDKAKIIAINELEEMLLSLI